MAALVSNINGVNILPLDAFLMQHQNYGAAGLLECKTDPIISLLKFLSGSPLPTGQSKFFIGIKTLTHLLLCSHHLHPVPTVKLLGIAWCSKNGICSITLYLQFSSLLILYGNFFLGIQY